MSLNILTEQNLMAPKYHISYPYTFEFRGMIYVCPETYQKGTIDLYELNLPPCRLKRVCTIIPYTQGIDPTIFYYNDYWWMFFGDFRFTPNKSLYLAYSKNLFDSWKIHKKCASFSPIVHSFMGARMAGNVLFYQDGLYRLGQCCVDGYGKAICVFKILKLNPYEYEEEFIKTVEPKGTSFYKYNQGIHHISELGKWTLIDAKRLKIKNDNSNRFSSK